MGLEPEELNLFETEMDDVDAADAMMKAAEPDPQIGEDNNTPEGDETPEGAEEQPEGGEEEEEAPEGDDTEGGEEEPEGEAEAVELDDDAELEVTVNGKVERVTLGALKALAGQDADLKASVAAVAQQRRVLEDQGSYVAKILTDRYNAAKANAQKYEGIDLYDAATKLEPEEFKALRAAKEQADAEVAALEREGAEFLQGIQKTRSDFLKAQAKEALKVITKAIPEWNDKLYDELRSYAVSQGMDRQAVNEVVDPGAIQMIHKAMKFDQLQAAKGKVTQKVIKAPKKTVAKGDNPADASASKIKALKREVQIGGGDVDDVTALFMAASEK